MRCNSPLTSLYLAILGLLIFPGLVLAQFDDDADALLDTYVRIKPMLENNVYGIPVYIESNGENNTMLGEIYGVIQHPYADVRQALGTPDNWCEIAPQHLNIKACTYQHFDGYCELTFYTGRKYYEAPEDVYQIPYRFSRSDNGNGYFHAGLTASKGPMGTKDYRIEVEAIALKNSGTFVHFSYSYKYNALTRMGMAAYLATLGSNKVGFSVTGKDEQGKPIYVDGLRGIIERNAVRHYLAIQSYLDTKSIAEKEQFNARINHWFELTENHHLQLYEMDKQDYLEYKQLERQDQLRLQQDVNSRNGDRNKCDIPQPSNDHEE